MYHAHQPSLRPHELGATIYPLFTEKGTEAQKGQSDLFNVTELVSDRAQIRTQVCLIPESL